MTVCEAIHHPIGELPWYHKAWIIPLYWLVVWVTRAMIVLVRRFEG